MNQTQSKKSFQFSVRSLLIITAMVGGTLGLLQLCSLAAVWLEEEGALPAMLRNPSPAVFTPVMIFSLISVPMVTLLLLTQSPRPWLVFVFISIVVLAFLSPTFNIWKPPPFISFGLALLIVTPAMLVEVLIRRLWPHLNTVGCCFALAIFFFLLPFTPLAFD